MANEQLEISSSSTESPPHRRGGKSRSIFNRLRLRSRSLANLSREKISNGSSTNSNGGGYFSSWFTRKPAVSPQLETTTTFKKKTITPNIDAESIPSRENGELNSCIFETSNINNGLTSMNIDDFSDRRQLSASHSNLHSTHYHPEMNGNDVHSFSSNAGTSRMPSYVNISLIANGYSRSRTNLHTVLSRSGDVHHLIVDGTDVTDVNPEHKAVIFVGDAMKKLPSPSNFSFLVPDFKVTHESLSIYQSLAGSLQSTLTKCVEQSEATLLRTDISDDAREAILVASGHTRVLLKSKIKKMLQLIEKHKETNMETVTLNDLASFWEMMDIDVSKIRSQFGIVEKFRQNNWKPLPEPAMKELPTPMQTPRTTAKPPKSGKVMPKVETPRTSATSTPRTRPNVKEFLAARRKEMANNQKLENGHNGDATLVPTQ